MRRLAVLALLASAPAAADDEPAEAIPKILAVKLDGTVARVAARYDLGAVGFGDNPSLGFTLPPRSIVTAATATVAGTTHKLQLVKPDSVTGTIEGILAAPPSRDRTWAIALTGDARTETVTAEVIAPEAARVSVDVDLEMQTCFFRGTRYVEFAPAGRDWLTPELARMIVAKPADVVAACGESTENVWLALPGHDADAPRVAVIAQRLPLSSLDFARVELDLARELADIPADLHTAVVIDGSRSMSSDESEIQRAIVGAYLRAAPQSRVQVIAYARRAQALLPGWQNATAAAARVDREIRALVARNGSNVDAGLAAAGEWLARVPGTHRVIVFTDQRVADRLANDDAKAYVNLLPAGTLVHVVAIETGDGELAHEDSVMFGPLAVATEGIGVIGRVGPKGVVDATLLARPVELEKIAIHAPGWDHQASLGEESCRFDNASLDLERGRSCTWWAQGTAAAGPVTITGMLWNSKLTRVVRPDPAGARTLARRMVHTSGLPAGVEHEIDVAAFALDSAWSMLATWGGKGGYADAENYGRIGLGGFGTCGCDGGVTDFGHGVASGVSMRLDLRAQLAKAVAACEPGGATVKIDLETTLQEIVDVDVSVTHGTPALHDCIVDGVWDTFLAIPNAPAHTHTSFVI